MLTTDLSTNDTEACVEPLYPTFVDLFYYSASSCFINHILIVVIGRFVLQNVDTESQERFVSELNTCLSIPFEFISMRQMKRFDLCRTLSSSAALRSIRRYPTDVIRFKEKLDPRIVPLSTASVNRALSLHRRIARTMSAVCFPFNKERN